MTQRVSRIPVIPDNSKAYIVTDPSGIYEIPPKPIKAHGPLEAKHTAFRKHIGSGAFFPYDVAEDVAQQIIDGLEAVEQS